MILDEDLNNLRIQIKNGGSLITHRPFFTPDSKNLLVVSGNKILVYNTQTFHLTATVPIPSADTVANIAVDLGKNDSVIVCTTKGGILDIEISSGNVKSQKYINFKPKGWSNVLLSIHNFVYARPKTYFVTAFVEGHPLLPTLYSVSETPEIPCFLEKLCVNILNNFHSVAVGADGDMLVAIQEHGLYARDCAGKTVKKHLYGERRLTSVAAHPTDWLCATGDDTGRVILWSNATISNVAAKTIFHWHTLPVADLAFSIDGSQILSGGGECTLVRWDIRQTENKRTVPRLGLPVRHVGVAAKNSLTVVSQADNTMKIISADNSVLGTIQNITQCYVPENTDDVQASEASLGGSKVYQAGLNVDPNTHALVMNGRPGQLQCYSFSENKHLYELDITNQNYVTAERYKAIPFLEVNLVSFSKTGRWLATAESRSENGTCTEVRLKFWKFEPIKQKFTLNTSIDWPHENGIIGLKMQPIDDSDPTLMAATSGCDRRFKTWGVVYDTSIHGKAEWWNCDSVGTHRGHPAGPLSFSADGSLLAVSFAHILTLWTTDSNEFLGGFSHLRLQDPLKFVEFGTKSSARLVICCSDTALAVWDVITFSLLWAIPFQAESLAVDPVLGIATVFSNKNHAYFFTPSNPEPLAVHHNVSKSRIISSVFIPGKSVGVRSILVFMNSSQELSAFVPKEQVEEEDSPATIKLAQAKGLPKTPFAQLIAQTTTNAVKPNPRLKGSPGLVGLLGAQIIREVIDSSPHTMPSISFYCERLLIETTAKASPADRFREVEGLVLASHEKRNVHFGLDHDGEEKMDVEETHKPGLSVTHMREPEDLKLVSDDDTSWISKIIFSE